MRTIEANYKTFWDIHFKAHVNKARLKDMGLHTPNAPLGAYRTPEDARIVSKLKVGGKHE